MRAERERKGEETEKTEKEERNCHVNLPPIGVYSGTKLHASRKGWRSREHPPLCLPG